MLLPIHPNSSHRSRKSNGQFITSLIRQLTITIGTLAFLVLFEYSVFIHAANEERPSGKLKSASTEQSASSPFNRLTTLDTLILDMAPGVPRVPTHHQRVRRQSAEVDSTRKLTSDDSISPFAVPRGSTTNSRRRVLRNVTILGLFELSKAGQPRPDGHSELAAAQLAVRHVNELQLLSDYRLVLVTNDTQCDAGVGVDRFFHAIYTQMTTRMIMLLGTACSEVTESLAKIVPYWNMLQVSFGSTSPALSDRREFPYFYRTVAPESAHNAARIAFIRRFGWDTVTTFTQNGQIHSLAVNDLVTELERSNISCAATITFAISDVRDQLQTLRDLDTRIIIGSFSHHIAAHIFCEAFRLGMYGADYAWIVHHDAPAGGGHWPWWWRQWWHSRTADCAAAEVAAAAENVLIVASHNRMVAAATGVNDAPDNGLNLKREMGDGGGDGDEQTAQSISGLTNQRFADELSLVTPELNVSEDVAIPPPMSPFAPQTYDAVWSMALALREAEAKWRLAGSADGRRPRTTLADFDYSRHDMTAELQRALERLSFAGVSGPVSFNGADRVGLSTFLQIQHGQLEQVALYRPAAAAAAASPVDTNSGHLDFECRGCAAIQWHGGQVPIARRVFRLKVTTIAPEAFYAVTAFAALGILLSLGCLVFNLHFRKFKSIKLSSPKLSNIIAAGCIFVYAAIILLGMDYSTLPANEKAFPIICTARVYLLSSGFSLAFGSMFAKTYRVHRIFTHTGGGGVCKDKMLRDTQLISLVCALLLLDALMVSLWVVVDPMQRHLSNLTLEISLTDRSVVYQPQVEVCRSHHTQTWLGALYAYKGLLLVVGVYMAWETRHVKIAALNDSQYIGASVYSVVITSAIVVVLAQLIADRVTLAFCTTTALIWLSTTATLSLLFLPKINGIWGKGRGDCNRDPIIHSMGLRLECNTRRFVCDDRREWQYRVEVQNRVYRKELAALDAEIDKLQRLLDATTSPAEGSSSPAISVSSRSARMRQTAGSIGSSAEQRWTPSGGCAGPPMLLLSVLPPVIPRASWPSAHPSSTASSNCAGGSTQSAVKFSSQPQLHRHQPAAGIQLLRRTHKLATGEGFFGRIRGLFSAGRSDSGGSMAEAQEPAVRRRNKLTVSCNALHLPANSVGHPQRYAKSDQYLPDIDGTCPRVFVISEELRRSADKIVMMKLPVMTDAGSHSRNLSGRKVRGSPRFPHRIVPSETQASALSFVDCADLSRFEAATAVAVLRFKSKSMDESISTTASSSTVSPIKATVDQSSVMEGGPTISRLRMTDSGDSI